MPPATRTQPRLDRHNTNSPTAPVSPISPSPRTTPSVQITPTRDASPVSPMLSLPPQLPPIKRVSSSFNNNDWHSPPPSRFDPFVDADFTERQGENRFEFQEHAGSAVQDSGDPSSSVHLRKTSAQDSWRESERSTYSSSKIPKQAFNPSADTDHRTIPRDADPRTQYGHNREPPLQLSSAHSEPGLSSTGRPGFSAPPSPQTEFASSVALSVPYSTTTASVQPTLGGKPLKSSANATFQNGVISHARTSSPRRKDIPSSKSSGKKGLALLNPVHLLMRRRSTQPSPDTAPPSISMGVVAPLSSLASDYDPRIRGNRVHDFSSPRRRISASTIPSIPSSFHPQPTGFASTAQTDPSEPPPTLPSHLDHDSEKLDTQVLSHVIQQERCESQAHSMRGRVPTSPHHRAAEIERQHSPFQPPHLASDALRMADQPRTEPEDLYTQQLRLEDHHSTDPETSPSAMVETSHSQPPQWQSDDHVASTNIDIDGIQSDSLNSTDPVLSAPDSQSPHNRTATTTPDSGLPRRFKSSASRFSFQMAGQDAITEEHLLEAKAKASESRAQKHDGDEEDEDFFDENAMYDQDEFEVQLDGRALPLAAPSQSDIPRHDVPGHSTHRTSTVPSDDVLSASVDDDMYYHDGMIDLHASDAKSEEPLDEAKFDDPTFLARDRDRSAIFSEPEFGAQDPYEGLPTHGSNHLRSSMQAQTTRHEVDGTSDYQNALVDAAQKAAANGRFDRRSGSVSSASSYSERSSQQERPPAQPLTEDNLHDHGAAGHGPMITDHAMQLHNSVPYQHHHDTYSGFDFGFGERRQDACLNSLSTSLPRTQLGEHPVTQGVYDDDDDYYANDDDIISEANADALASDDEGFYSQEFGFYARARSGSLEEDATNGGYFGEPGIDGIERKWSVREPNLTPITERSEFSTRNSVAGGPRSPGFGPTSNPSFAAAQQLSRHSPMASLAQLQQEELSLDRLLHMRTQSFNSDIAGRRTESMSSIGSVGLAQLRAMTSTPDTSGRGAPPAGLQYGYGTVSEERPSLTRSLGSSRLANQDSAEFRHEHDLRDGTLGLLATSDAYITPKRSTLNTSWSPEAPMTAFKTSPVKHSTHRRHGSSDGSDGRAKDWKTLNRLNDPSWT